MLISPVITLTTDFGYDDPFVGVMKGVILKINPYAKIIDITHNIKPQDIRAAALVIGMNYHYFPEGTIHICIVDPTVGSSRRPILVRKNKHYFIGPDNGIFSMVYESGEKKPDVIHITDKRYFLQAESSTFQGRDIFSPVAAYLSKGLSFFDFGSPIIDYVKIKLSQPEVRKNEYLTGEIVHIDRFGNAISNIRTADIDRLCGEKSECRLKIFLNGRQVLMKDFYSQAEDNGLYAIIDSSGYLEFFVFKGNASFEYSISIGDRVEIHLNS